jgi:hypothetical protein
VADDAPSIWEKVDFSIVYATDEKSAATRTIGPPEGYWKWRRPVLDVVASLLWLFAILKVFLVDVDREVLGALSDYRAFFFIAIAVGFVFLLRRTGTFIAGMLYVVFYPLVVLLWKVPKWLYRLRSPGAFLATGNAIAGVFGNIRHSIVTFAIAAFTTLLIAVGTSDVLLAAGGVIMAGLVLQAIWRTVKLSVPR